MDYSSSDFSEEEKRAESKSSRIVPVITKVLLIALFILLLSFVTSHCLPLLKPVGESILQRLWDVLRFIVITTAVSFGILNSQWKAIERADSLKEEDGRYRQALPLNHAIFNETDQLKRKEDFVNDFSDESPKVFRSSLQVSGNEGANKIEYETYGIASIADLESLAGAPDEEQRQTKPAVSTGTASNVWKATVGYGQNFHTRQEVDLDVSNRNATEGSKDHSGAGPSNCHLSGEKYSRGLAISPVNEGLTAVTNSNFNSTSVSKERPILHRRITTPPDLDDVKSKRRSSSVEGPVQRHSSKVLNSVDEDGPKAANVDTIVKTQVQPEAATLFVRNKPASVRNLTLSSRHSRSALNLEELNENEMMAKSSRRNTSYSCDFGDDYTPEWLTDYPPSPPSLTDPSDSEMEASYPNAKPICSPHAKVVPLSHVQYGKSSPVDIAASTNSSVSNPPPAASGGEPASTSVGPSPGELNKKADAFIARFYEQIRLQRVESFERRRRNSRLGRRVYNY